MLRYKPDKVFCLIDSRSRAQNASAMFGSGKDIPIYASISDVTGKVDTMVLCMVLPEGRVPDKWISEIILALKNNIDVINPLHVNFSTVGEIANKFGGTAENSTPQITSFKNTKGKIYNLRTVPDDLELMNYEVLKTRAVRVLTVGSDCNLGKMLTTIELDREAKRRGYNSDYIATGQISMLLKGSGMAIDRVISDFVPGAVERLILEKRDRDIVFIEGQGSIFQPIYSAVSMGLLHGSAPHKMIFCHLPSRKKIRYSNLDFPDMKTMIRLHEELASIVLKSRVTGISLNCHDMSDNEARDIIKMTQDLTGLPCTDPVKFGVEDLADSIFD
ncbi:MAG: DUF1611 domain-containing protein [Oligoflexia bacterium]|nr:DUF1611 domain-containing protein [Oligoflexia bacterium]